MFKDELLTSQMIVMTGWHVLSAGNELKKGFNMCDVDVAPLDAPAFISAGSTHRASSGSITGTICISRWLTMFK